MAASTASNSASNSGGAAEAAPFSHRPRGSYTWEVRETGPWRFSVKKFLGIFALLGALAGAIMFWRRRADDDEFLDEELE